MYTLYKEIGTLDGINILCVGDMRMRTMHSIGYAASQFDINLTLVYPDEMSPLDEFRDELRDKNVQFTESQDVRDVIGEADVIYMEPVVQPDYTKARDERDGDVGLTPPEFQVTSKLMKEKAKSDAIVLHSLPRMDELLPEVDSTRHARYWIEAFNGVVMRMALLALVLGKME
jgi:aspartate carbamoyltransferase catalytic subunit